MKVRTPVLALTSLLILAAFTPTVEAHEHFTIDDRYEFSVGWIHEPAYVDAPNGVSIGVTDIGDHHGHDDHDSHAAGTPVEGAEETLQVEVSIGGQSKVFDLATVWGQPGSYKAEFTPTMPGVYTFHITGTVNGSAVDQVIEYTADPVQSPEESRWPEQPPSAYEMQRTIEGLEGQIEDLETRLAALEEGGDGTQVSGEETNDAPGAGVLAAVAALGAVAFVARRRT